MQGALLNTPVGDPDNAWGQRGMSRREIIEVWFPLIDNDFDRPSRDRGIPTGRAIVVQEKCPLQDHAAFRMHNSAI